MSPAAGQATTGTPEPARAPPCRGRRGRSPPRSAAWCARRTPSPPPARSAGTRSGARAGAGWWWPAPARARRRGPRAPPAACGARGPARCSAPPAPAASSPGGSSTSLEGLLPQQRPRDAHRRVAVVARVLELGEGGHQRQLARDAAVHVVERRQPHALARAVQLRAARARSPPRSTARAPPADRAEPRARQARADRVRREARLARGQHVGDRAWPTGRSSICAARLPATVRMSATTACGSNSWISGTVSRAARTAAW